MALSGTGDRARALSNDKMAVFSGYNQSLDARSDASEELCCARRAHESVLIGSKLYVFGGYCLRDYPEHEFEFRRQQIFSYDIVTKKWIQHTTKAENDSNMPRPCTGAKCAALGHTIYSFGGLQVNITDQMRLFSNKTYALDTTTMTWRCCKVDGTAVPSGRDKYALCVDDTKLLIFGGWSLRIDKNRLQDGAVWVPEEDKIVGWNNELYAFETETGGVDLSKTRLCCFMYSVSREMGINTHKWHTAFTSSCSHHE